MSYNRTPTIIHTVLMVMALTNIIFVINYVDSVIQFIVKYGYYVQNYRYLDQDCWHTVLDRTHYISDQNKNIRQIRNMLTLPGHTCSLSVFSEVRVTQSLVLCIMFCRSLFVLFLLATVLSVSLLIPSGAHQFTPFLVSSFIAHYSFLSRNISLPRFIVLFVLLGVWFYV